MNFFSIIHRSREEGLNLLRFTSYHALNCPLRMFENLLCRKRGTVPSYEEEGVGKALFGLFCKINDLGDIGKVVQTEASGPNNPPKPAPIQSGIVSCKSGSPLKKSQRIKLIKQIGASAKSVEPIAPFS